MPKKINLDDKNRDIENLVDLVKEGDHEAFSELYDIFVDPIYRYVYYRVNSSDAEDLVATIFVKVWENIRKYRAKKRTFSAWIFKIAHNIVVDYYRAAKDRNFDELNLNIDVASAERQHNPIKVTETQFDNKLLKSALANLKKDYQDIIIYKFINEFSNPEIAALLGKSEGSLRILQFRALKALRRELENAGLNYEI